MNQNEKYEQALSFWTMSFNYLQLVEAVVNETIKQGNIYTVISDKPIDCEEYESHVKWSDFNIVVPVIYNFYHGLELVLKGFILLQRTENLKLDHDIEKLFKEFTQLYSDETPIICILKKYISNCPTIEPLKRFFSQNGISSNRFYEALRYPCDKNINNSFEHIFLKYNGKEGINFFETLKNDISNLQKLFVTLGRSYE